MILTFFPAFLFFLIYNKKGKKGKKKRKKRKEEYQMTVYENHDTEYKEQYVSGIGKEVVAFANYDGGTLSNVS